MNVLLFYYFLIGFNIIIIKFLIFSSYIKEIQN